MKCPVCGGRTEVKESRPRAKNTEVRRRRRCIHCDHRFSTLEEVHEPAHGPRAHELVINPKPEG